MNNLHNINMEIIFAAIVYSLLNILFISTQFFKNDLYFSIILFALYCLMIKQYYETNHKIIEFKDLVFTICYVIIVVLIYILFDIYLNLNEIYILFTISYISFIFYASELRNR